MKPEHPGTRRIVYYSEKTWKILRDKRIMTLNIMSILQRYSPIVYGSIARGDVDEDSDIDIVIPNPEPYSIVKYLLESGGYKIFEVELVIATPKSTPKLCIYLSLDRKTVVSLPLSKFTKSEEEFFRYAGYLNYEELSRNIMKRVPGVDKRLMLIIPTEFGHIEESIIGREYEVSRILNVNPDIVFEREKMLLRRSEKGRTGLFFRISIDPDQPVEEIVLDIIRKKLKKNI